MPYRITMTVDVPDGEKPQDAARIAYSTMSDMEEAAAKRDGDIQDYDVEWYGFGDDEEGPWTYADEELLRTLVEDTVGPGLDDDDDEWIDNWLRDEADSDEQAARVACELRMRRERGEL